MTVKQTLVRKAKQIRMLIFDVDGVLTDGGLYFSANGLELKRFNAQDGYGIVRAREAGLKIGLISGRSSPVVEARAKQLQVDELLQGREDKVAAFRELQTRHPFSDEEFMFMGDDLFDIPLLKTVGLSASPRNGRPEVRKCVDLVTNAAGGDGAARELIEFVLAHGTHRRT